MTVTLTRRMVPSAGERKDAEVAHLTELARVLERRYNAACCVRVGDRLTWLELEVSAGVGPSVILATGRHFWWGEKQVPGKVIGPVDDVDAVAERIVRMLGEVAG